MKQVIIVFLAALLLSCNDGNVDVPSFDFSDVDISICGEENMVLYKVKDNEAIAIELVGIIDTIFTDDGYNKNIKLSPTGANKITYRTFDDAPKNYFCNNIPPTTPLTITEWTGEGSLDITVAFYSEDDNDGIPTAEEDINGDGDYNNDDTDGDDIPNYIDIDDDGDGILTSVEKGKGDSDNDGIPDYLDDDDDNDNILTRYESTTEDDDGDGIVNYLDADSKTPMTTPRKQLENNIYTIKYLTTFLISPLELTNKNGDVKRYEIFDYGNYIASKKDTLTPAQL